MRRGSRQSPLLGTHTWAMAHLPPRVARGGRAGAGPRLTTLAAALLPLLACLCPAAASLPAPQNRTGPAACAASLANAEDTLPRCPFTWASGAGVGRRTLLVPDACGLPSLGATPRGGGLPELARARAMAAAAGGGASLRYSVRVEAAFGQGRVGNNSLWTGAALVLVDAVSGMAIVRPVSSNPPTHIHSLNIFHLPTTRTRAHGCGRTHPPTLQSSLYPAARTHKHVGTRVIMRQRTHAASCHAGFGASRTAAQRPLFSRSHAAPHAAACPRHGRQHMVI